MLALENVTTAFAARRGTVKAVDGVDFRLGEGEIVGLVGESGCGKSMTLLSILRLVPRPGRIVSGRIMFHGEDLLRKSRREMRSIRGKDIAMVFQDPLATLNPVFPVGEQIRESLRIHGLGSGGPGRLSPFGRGADAQERRRVLDLMREVGIPSPDARFSQYPHQFSGGMQQRALIAIALACEPKLLLADEPTTALDVTIQAQILDLLREVNRRRGTGIILVTHDLGVAAEFCQEIAVMYAGRIVERGPTDAVIEDPRHPYTQGLLRSIPRLVKPRVRLRPISGSVPDLADLPPYCAFEPRCERADARCRREMPAAVELGDGRSVRCLLHR